MLPLNIKIIGIKNLLTYFPPLAILVLAGREGGSPREIAVAMGVPEEIGKYVEEALTRLEREVVDEVLRMLSSDNIFFKNLREWLLTELERKDEESRKAILTFVRYVVPEMNRYEYSLCIDKEDFQAYLKLLGVERDKVEFAFSKFDSIKNSTLICTPIWMEKVLSQDEFIVDIKDESIQIIKNFIKGLFWNPKGYAAFRSAVFKDVPVIPLDRFPGDIVVLDGVFDGKRVNPALVPVAKREIIQLESQKAPPDGILDEELGVYKIDNRVYVPAIEALGWKVLNKYRNSKIYVYIKSDFEIKQYGNYLKKLNIEIL